MRPSFDQLVQQHEELLNRVKMSKAENGETEQFLTDIRNFMTTLQAAGAYIANPQQRDQLRKLLSFWASHIYEQTGIYPDIKIEPLTQTRFISFSLETLKLIILLLVLGIIVIVGIWLYFGLAENILSFLLAETPAPTPTPTLTPTPSPMLTDTPTLTATYTSILTPTPVLPLQSCEDDTSRFGMCVSTTRWQPEQNGSDTKAIITADGARLNVNLDGKSDIQTKGEAFIDMRYSIPRGFTEPAPYDFTEQTVECWVWVPLEAWGKPSAPNGLRLYLKDESFDSEYSKWLNIDGTAQPDNNWFRVALSVSRGERFGDFDPTHVRLIGIQLATNRNYTGSYQGPIYVDRCNWAENSGG